MKMDDQGKSYIEVSCGKLNGVLYLEKLRKTAGAKGMNKCILCDSNMLTPSEFEFSGGKKANRAWKKSIKHKNKPLAKYFASGALKECTGQEPPSPTTQLLLPTTTPGKGIAIDEAFKDLEQKLTQSIEGVVKSAVQSLRRSLEADIKSLVNKVDSLSQRVTELEKSRSEKSSPQSPPTSLPSAESMQSQIKKLTDTVNNYQRVLELKERANRANNIVITGIQEALPNEDTPTIVSEFLNSRMGITSIKISQARRLGRSQLSTHKPRPILATFHSHSDKSQVLSKRASLAGSKIFINHDLTKEQMEEEKKLREAKKKLALNPQFQGKKTSIYRNKLWVDRSPIPDGTLRAAGISY